MSRAFAKSKTCIPTYKSQLLCFLLYHSNYLVLPYSIKQIRPAGDAIRRNNLSTFYQYSNPIGYVVQLNAELKVNKQVEVHEYTYIIPTSASPSRLQCRTWPVKNQTKEAAFEQQQKKKTRQVVLFCGCPISRGLADTCCWAKYVSNWSIEVHHWKLCFVKFLLCIADFLAFLFLKISGCFIFLSVENRPCCFSKKLKQKL